jgi:hypothetical protein
LHEVDLVKREDLRFEDFQEKFNEGIRGRVFIGLLLGLGDSLPHVFEKSVHQNT